MRNIIVAAIAAATLGWSGAAWGACGCTALTVTKSSGSTGFICTVAQLNFPECTERTASGVGCPSTYNYAYQCPTGVNNPSGLEQRVGFQVAAAVSGSASQCHSGQALQLTITSNRGVTKPDIHATPTSGVRTIGGYAFYVSNTTTNTFPDVGATKSVSSTTYPLYGGDNYTAAGGGTLIEIDDSRNRVVWWDNTDQEKDDVGESATWKYKFISFVEGSSSSQTSCACVLDVAVTWNANAAATTTIAKDTTNSSNCTVN